MKKALIYIRGIAEPVLAWFTIIWLALGMGVFGFYITPIIKGLIN